MGWDGDFRSKMDAVAAARVLISWRGTRRIHAEKVSSNAYYMVVDDEAGVPFISVTIFKGRAPRIVYKVMDEAAHPFKCADCPLQFLELAPETNGAWRAEVRAYWAKNATK